MAVLFGETILSNAGMQNGKLSVTVASNNLVVAVKTLGGGDPSASDPVYIRINGIMRTISAALSITVNAGTNWFNSGGTGLATKLIPYFPYAVYDSNSSAVALTIGRKPCYRVVESGMTTTTSENHIYGYSGFTDGDDMVNIGYFEATLSAGAGYTWTVPTFTNNNLKSEPVFFSNEMEWAPEQSRSGTNYTNSPTQDTAKYMVVGNKLKIVERHTQDASPGGTDWQQFTLPFAPTYVSTLPAANGTTAVGFLLYMNAGVAVGTLYKASDGSAEATGSQTYLSNGEYDIS